MARKSPEDRIRRYVLKWKPRLLLNHWSVDLEFAKEDKSIGPKLQRHAESVANTPYTEHKVTIFPCLLEKPAAYQQATVVHELAHAITDRVNVLLTKAVYKGVIPDKQREEALETLTEAITKIVLAAYTKNTKDFLL